MKENQKRFSLRTSILPALMMLSLLQISSPSYAEPPSQSILPKDSRVPGGIAVIPLQEASSSVKFNGKNVLKIQDNNKKHWAIIGIPLHQKTGPTQYSIDGKEAEFLVADKAYKEQYLTVKRKHSNPPEDQIKRIQKESRLSKIAFTTFSDINQDKTYQNFLLPAKGPISSPFGLKRFFNEQARRPHSGIDIAAAKGSDIIAPADGEVILTGDFFFNGNSIFIDHGQGLITLYCHMDELNIAIGDDVKAGDIIGKVGSTGRATGPHLHWTVSLNNNRIEPLLFINSQ